MPSLFSGDEAAEGHLIEKGDLPLKEEEMTRARRLMALVVTLAMLMAWVSPVRVAAAEESTPVGFDALVLRPLGILATAFGTAVFLVSLPFSAPTGSVEHMADKLVVEPYRFTFERPMGAPTYHYQGGESPGL